MDEEYWESNSFIFSIIYMNYAERMCDSLIHADSSFHSIIYYRKYVAHLFFHPLFYDCFLIHLIIKDGHGCSLTKGINSFMDWSFDRYLLPYCFGGLGLRLYSFQNLGMLHLFGCLIILMSHFICICSFAFSFGYFD